MSRLGYILMALCVIHVLPALAEISPIIPDPAVPSEGLERFQVPWSLSSYKPKSEDQKNALFAADGWRDANCSAIPIWAKNSENNQECAETVCLARQKAAADYFARRELWRGMDKPERTGYIDPCISLTRDMLRTNSAFKSCKAAAAIKDRIKAKNKGALPAGKMPHRSMLIQQQSELLAIHLNAQSKARAEAGVATRTEEEVIGAAIDSGAHNIKEGWAK